MKKPISILGLAVALTVTLSANAQSDNSFIGKAHGAAHDCLQPYLGPTYEIDAFVEETSICFVSGSLHTVTFTAGPKCNGNGPCPTFPTRIIATVDFNCEGEVVSVNCVE